MQAVTKPRLKSVLQALAVQLVRAAVLLFPAGLLLVATLRSPVGTRPMLGLGTVFLVLACSLSLLSRKGRNQPLGPSVIALYLIGLGWLWWGAQDLNDWFGYLARAFLLVTPMGIFALQTL